MQAWSIKDLLYGKKHQSMICILAGQSPYPERARWSCLARSGSQSQREIRFILPAHGARHIIRVVIDGDERRSDGPSARPITTGAELSLFQ